MDLIRNKSALDKNNTKTCLQLMPRGLTTEDKVLQASTGGTSSIDGNLKKMNKGLADTEKLPLERYGITRLRPDMNPDQSPANIVVTTNQINVEKQNKTSQKGSRNSSSKRRDSLVKKAHTLFQSPLLPKLEHSKDYTKLTSENSVLLHNGEGERSVHQRKGSAFGSITVKEVKSVHSNSNQGGSGGHHGPGLSHYHANNATTGYAPSKQLNMILNNINLQSNLLLPGQIQGKRTTSKLASLTNSQQEASLLGYQRKKSRKSIKKSSKTT
jgi:hypothetical protein